MKLKIGQKFKVVDEWNEEAKLLINNEGKMDKWQGKIMTVRDINDLLFGNYSAEEDRTENDGKGWCWHYSMIDWKATNKLNGVDE